MEFDLIKEISKAQKGLSKKQIYYTKKDLEILHQYIMKQNERIISNRYTCRELIYDEFEKDLDNYVKTTGTNMMQVEDNALQILSTNPAIVDRVYDKIKDKDLEKFDFEKEKYRILNGEEQSIEYEMCLMLKELRKEKVEGEIKEILYEELHPKDENKRQKMREKIQESDEYKKTVEYTKILLEPSERKQIEMAINYRKKGLEEALFDKEKEGFKLSGEFLKKYGFLREELEQQNKDYRDLSLSNMQYELRTENMDDDIGLENIFEDSYLDTLSLEQLTVLNAFWQNRFTKKIERNKKSTICSR